MRNSLPPLRALRDFEAVGRHKSLSAAARSLSVTPAAVSRQISLLEARLQCKLFVRHHRGLEITDKGKLYLAAVRDAFDRLDTATTELFGQRRESALSVRVYTTLAMEWLIPRLGSFRRRHPEIRIDLVASHDKIDFDAGVADIALVPMAGVNPRLRQDLLFQPRFTPVCNPELTLNGAALRHPDDLQEHTLLYSRRLGGYWQSWLAEAGVVNCPPEHGLWFESSSQAYQAAREGAGVALGLTMFIQKDLTAGTLIAPFGSTVAPPWDYWIASPRRRANEPHIAAFRDWIIEQRDLTTAQLAITLDRKPELREANLITD